MILVLPCSGKAGGREPQVDKEDRDGSRFELEFVVRPMDFNGAGEAASKIKRTLQLIGFDPEVVRRTAIVAYEAEMNLVIHGGGGILRSAIGSDCIDIVAEDKGPGIPDIEKAFQEGYSTAPEYVRELGFGAGMGLPNMRKNADLLFVESEVGKGTRVRAIISSRGVAQEDGKE